MTRLAIVSRGDCKSKDCGQVCIKYCPVNLTGLQCIVLDEKKIATISEYLCNGCGICEKICPVDNIKLVNEKPEWQHKCQMCTGCLHYCPQKAIQWGEYTLGRERYNHPKIKLKELLAQNPK